MTESQRDLTGVSLELVNSVEKAGEFLSWLGERRPYNAIAIDTETGELPGNLKTDAFSPWHGKLRLVQVGDGMTGWSIPWEEWNGVFYQAMDKFDGPIVCHNIAFEARWFAVQSRWQVPWERMHDTMIMSRIINPLESAALKELSAKHVDRYAAHLQDVLGTTLSENGWTWGTVPINFEPYWSYGALDTVLTMRLWEKFYKLCGPDGAYHKPYELEMQTRKIATKMELNGCRVDLDYSKKKYQELLDFSQEVKLWGDSRYGISIGSNPQLVRTFETLGGDFTEYTPGGAKSANKDQLKKFMIDGNDSVKELADAVVRQRKAEKLANTYFLNFLDKSVDGFVHPSINTLAARTSRMSITDPALQTLPKGDATVRRAFLPKDDDHVLITSDLDQVEFRMFSTLSGDENLIELFNHADAVGSDPFTEIGRQVYRDPSMQKSDKRRNLIKGVVYGRLYGAGVAKQALTAGVPEAQMREVSDSFDLNYPGMAMFQRKIDDLGQRRYREEGQGYVYTWTGRRIPCDDDRTYTLVNYLIQGGAAEVFKSNLLKLDQAGLTDYLVVPVHDEIVLQAPRDEAPEVMQLVRECMTTREGWAVPLTADVDGPLENWGQKYE